LDVEVVGGVPKCVNKVKKREKSKKNQHVSREIGKKKKIPGGKLAQNRIVPSTRGGPKNPVGLKWLKKKIGGGPMVKKTLMEKKEEARCTHRWEKNATGGGRGGVMLL